ncbi:MAG: DUF998 domain-containing protein [Anaerolineae bacterium]
MNTASTPSLSEAGFSSKAVLISMGLSTLFLVLLFLLHFLAPELDPSWRMISEYEIGPYGWMMRLAFFCWGGSVLALIAALRPYLRTRSGKTGFGWLVVIGVALFGAGLFATDPITNITDSFTNRMHTLAGAVVIFTFPIAATLAARGLAQHPQWVSSRRWVWGATVLVWLGLVLYVGTLTISVVTNPAAGKSGPDVLQGWPNRIMVVLYILWLLIVAQRARRVRA